MRLVIWHVGQPRHSPWVTMTCLLSLFIFISWFTWPQVWPVISVGLDAGHGGIDPGAIGHSGLKEKTVTLQVARLVSTLLKEAGEEANLIRYNDSRLARNQRSDLQARVRVAQQKAVDIFVSIHCNGFRLKSVRGPSTYYQPGSESGKSLAGFIQSELVRVIGYGKKNPIAEDHLVTRVSNMTAVIVELGYITNPGEEVLLADDAFQHKLARAVVEGIRKYAAETGL